MTDIRQQLLAAFDIEHREHLEAIRRALRGREAGVDLREIFRRAHSLKGAARAVDLPAVEALAHELEGVFSKIMDGEMSLDQAAVDRVQTTLDAIEAKASGEEPAPDAEPEPEAAATEYVRVEVDEVGRLSRAMQELAGDLQGRGAVQGELRRLKSGAERLQALWGEMRPAATPRSRDFEQLLKALVRDTAAIARREEAADWAVEQGARQVREQIEQISLTPAETVFGGLGRMVRDLARESDAEVEVDITGLQVQADRRVLQALKDPVMHLMRNALSHGMEAGRRLTIGLEATARGGRLHLRVFDDGRGPDLAKLEKAAVEKGLLQPGLGASPDELMTLAFEPGLSTAAEVDKLAGRGMGLSVVAETVRRLRGGVQMRRRQPSGAEIALSVPLQIARQALVVVEAGGHAYALPSFGVKRLLRLPAEQVESVEGHPAVRIGIDGSDVIVPIVPLNVMAAVNQTEITVEAGAVKALLAGRGDRYVALSVDAFRDVREGLVEEPSTLGLDPAIVSGAVLLDDETPALVLDAEGLVERWLRDERRLAAAGLGFAPRAEAAPAQRTVLVVDDSITTRTLEKSILEAQGYRVLLAVDGLDALSILRAGDAVIDLVVADIEMPRMDGFSLLQAVKADAGLAATPVILMTSRADPEDVRRGLDLGAEAYITKQKFDQRELLATIGRLL